jgi:alpha-tubulin suppressor-like RCC1 family protein
VEKIMDSVACVAAGDLHTMIVKQDGTLWATGNNFYNQLGIGAATATSTPVQIMGGVAVVAAGEEHSMILMRDGTVYGTGEDSDGRLGARQYGTTSIKVSP